MKTKSKLLLAMGLTLSLGLAACGNETTKGADSKVEQEVSNKTEYEGEKKSDVVDYVLPKDVLQKIKDKETFVFVVGNQTCSACADFKDNGLKDYVAKEKEKLIFVETFNLEADKEQADAFVSIVNEHLKGEFEATPTTYFIVDGEYKTSLVGSVTYKELKEAIDKNLGKSK